MDTSDINKLNLIKKNIDDIGVKEKVNSYTDHVNFLLELINKQSLEINSLYSSLHNNIRTDINPEFVKELIHVLKKYHLIVSPTTA